MIISKASDTKSILTISTLSMDAITVVEIHIVSEMVLIMIFVLTRLSINMPGLLFYFFRGRREISLQHICLFLEDTSKLLSMAAYWP